MQDINVLPIHLSLNEQRTCKRKLSNTVKRGRELLFYLNYARVHGVDRIKVFNLITENNFVQWFIH